MPVPPPPLLPYALAAGDAVAVVSPSGPVRDVAIFEAGLARLRAWGLVPHVGAHVLDTHGFLAGDDNARLTDLQRAINDPAMRGIFISRGGYGITRLLGHIDMAPLQRDPRPIVGYSDVTALLLGAHAQTGLVGFHSPMVATRDTHAGDARTDAMQRALLMEPAPFGLAPADALDTPPAVLVAGRAIGPLIGGNLSLLAALAGTPWMPATRGALIFIEDVGEPPYRIDRMLTTLRDSGFFTGIAGVLVGDFSDCRVPVGTEATDLTWVFRDRLGALGVPVVSGLPFGHRARQWTLPVGATARLVAPAGGVPTVELCGPATRHRA